MNQQATNVPVLPAKPADRIFPVPGWLGLLVVVIIYFISMSLGVVLLNLYPALMGWGPVQADTWLSSSTSAQFAYVFAVEAITIGLLWFFMRMVKIGWSQIGLIRPKLKYFGVALLAYGPYFVLNAAATLGAVALFDLDAGQAQQTGFEAVRSTSDLALTFVSLVILPPLVEEIVMRGFLFSSLKRNLTVVRATIVTSVVFAIAHLQFGSGAPLLWVAAIDTFVLSLVLCYLRQKTGNLWAGIGLHAIKNGLAFTVLFLVPNTEFLQGL